jgi:hypothetical protein
MNAHVYRGIVQLFVLYLSKTSVIKIKAKAFSRCVRNGNIT